jgi:hypothetical protein
MYAYKVYAYRVYAHKVRAYKMYIRIAGNSSAFPDPQSSNKETVRETDNSGVNGA